MSARIRFTASEMVIFLLIAALRMAAIDRARLFLAYRSRYL